MPAALPNGELKSAAIVKVEQARELREILKVGSFSVSPFVLADCP
jgi:hypothetical protein